MENTNETTVNEVNATAITATANATQSIGLGQLVIGQTLEVGTSTKNGVTTKANYYRLSNKQDLPLVGAKLITSSKDKIDFAVNVKEITNKDLLEILSRGVTANPEDELSKVSIFIKDCFYSAYKEMANAAYNSQSKVIKLGLMDVIEFATMARSRTRKAISFTGEYFKLSQAALLQAFITYAKEDRGIIVSEQVAIKTMISIKLLLTIEQMIPSEKQLDTLAGMFSYVPEGELSNNLAAIIELKNELFNNVGELEEFV